jgi:hypothetical protein
MQRRADLPWLSKLQAGRKDFLNFLRCHLRQCGGVYNHDGKAFRLHQFKW